MMDCTVANKYIILKKLHQASYSYIDNRYIALTVLYTRIKDLFFARPYHLCKI